MRKKLLLGFCALFMLSITIFAQTTATGKVVDEKGAAISGATVLEKGSKNGTTTASDGSYSLKVKAGAKLVISSVGYGDANVTASTNAKTSLVSRSADIDEVVVTALGISRDKKAISYSAQTVTADGISSSGRTNLIDDINGKVSGVQITNSGGQAGSGSTIVIRGYNSLTGNNQPLYVVDGVPIDNSYDIANNSANGSYTVPTANRAIDLNPDDVESLTVLKGGAATALYGIQAANGAIIINTKKGRSGKINIEANYSYGFASANKFPELSSGFMRGSGGNYNTVTTNNWGPLASTNPVFAAGTKLDLVGTGTPVDVSGQKIPYYGDNFKNFFVNGQTQKYGIALSGGSDNSTFYAAISRLDQNAIVRNNNYQKTSAIINISNQLTKKLKLEAKVNYINSGGLRFNSGKMMNQLDYYVNTWDIQTFPWKDKNAQETWWQTSLGSPMWTVNETGERYNIDRFISNIGASYKISNDWYIDYKLGFDNYSENRKNVDPIGTLGNDITDINNYGSTGNLGAMADTRINSSQINSDIMLHFNKKLNKDFSIQALVGQNIFYKKYDVLGVTGFSFVLPDFFELVNTSTQKIYRNSFKKKTLGLYGNVQVNYKDYLFLDASLRNDWSSTLPRNNNNFLYPALSAAFIFSEFTKIDWLSFGKFRASYAGTANDAPVNSLVTGYISNSPIAGNIRYSYPSTEVNPNIKPERTKQYEVGLDVGLFKRKVFIEATYYFKESFDQIIYAPSSNATGVDEKLINLGKTINKGLDATITFKDIVSAKNLSWTSAFNFSKNIGTVMKVGDNGNDKVTLVGSYYSTAEINAKKGMPFGAIYGYAWKRYGVTEDNPDYLKAPILLDASGKPTLTDNKVLLGNTSPKFILAWNNTVSYKNFSLGLTMEWRHGGDVINDFNQMLSYSGKSALTQDRYYSATYAGANATKTFTGVDATGKSATGTPISLTKAYYTGTFVRNDELFVEDASWIRLRNIYLSYSLSEKTLKHLKLKGVDFTVAGRNIWLNTKYTGVDPEVSSVGSGANGAVGLDHIGIPSTKSWEVSVKLKF